MAPANTPAKSINEKSDEVLIGIGVNSAHASQSRMTFPVCPEIIASKPFSKS
jgi:hypothetical protein